MVYRRTEIGHRCRAVLERAPILSFGKLALKDLTPARAVQPDVQQSARAALAWLCRAQDKSGDGGFSYGFSLKLGWRAAYRETTGYIIVTLLRFHARFPDLDLERRALRAADWLLTVQNADGSFANPRFGSEGIVFDTGQVLFGLIRAFETRREQRYFEAANRAADWLVRIADPGGRWTHREHLGAPHVYNTRTAWALALAMPLGDAANRERVVRANCDWALSQERGGWFENNAFRPGDPPFTHNIAYNIRGLQRCGQLLGEPRYLDSAGRGLAAMLPLIRDDGFIPGRIDVRGLPQARYSCLTGQVQLSTCWAEQHRIAKDPRFQSAAVRSLRYVQTTQLLDTDDADVRGAIKGSHPIWGGYSPFTFPNWATKFFLDALADCEEWL